MRRLLSSLVLASFALLAFLFAGETASASVTFTANTSNPAYETVTINFAPPGSVNNKGYNFISVPNGGIAQNCPTTYYSYANTPPGSNAPVVLDFDFETSNYQGICAGYFSGANPTITRWEVSGIPQNIDITMNPVTVVYPTGSASMTVTPYNGGGALNTVNFGVVKPHNSVAFNKVSTSGAFFDINYTAPRAGSPVDHYSYKWASQLTGTGLNVNSCLTNGGGGSAWSGSEDWLATLSRWLFPQASANHITSTYANTPLPFSSNVSVPADIGNLNILCIIATNDQLLDSSTSETQYLTNAKKIMWRQDTSGPSVGSFTPGMPGGATVSSSTVSFTVSDTSNGIGFSTATLADHAKFYVHYYDYPIGLPQPPVAIAYPTCSYAPAGQEHTVNCTATAPSLTSGTYQVKVHAEDDLGNAISALISGPYFTISTGVTSPVARLIISNYTYSGGGSTDQIIFKWVEPSTNAPVDYTFYYEAMSASPSPSFNTSNTITGAVNIPVSGGSITSTPLAGGGNLLQYTLNVAPLANPGDTYFYRLVGRNNAQVFSTQSPIAFMYGDVTDDGGTVTAGPYSQYPDYKLTFHDSWKLKYYTDGPGISPILNFMLANANADVIQTLISPSTNAANPGVTPVPDGTVDASDAWRLKYHTDSPYSVFLPNY